MVDWYKFVRKVMDREGIVGKGEGDVGKGEGEGRGRLGKVELVGKVVGIFRRYLAKRKIWRGV